MTEVTIDRLFDARLIDPGWAERDQAWNDELIERLRRGQPLEAVAASDAYPRPYWQKKAQGGWEEAEEHAKDAIRTGASFLDDFSIRQRQPERARRKAAYAEFLVKHRAELAERRVEWAEQAGARAAADAARRERYRIETEQRDPMIQAQRNLDLRFRIEVRQMLDSKWQCPCGATATIHAHENGYIISCLACGKTAFGTHEALSKVVPV